MVLSRLSSLALVLATAYFVATPAFADATSRFQGLYTVASDGLGLGATYDVHNGNEFRIQADAFHVNTNGSGSYYLTGTNGDNPVQLNLAYSEHIQVGGLSLLFDHHIRPEKPFFVSAGIVNNWQHIDASTTPTSDSLVFAGQNYSAAALGTLGIHARWNTIAPYAGIGWANKNANGHLHGPMYEIGGYYIGNPKVTFTPEGVVSANPAIFNPYLESLQGTLQGQLGGIKIYPVLRASFPL